MGDQRKSDAAPSAGNLREAAIAHLARFATSQAGLARVLDKRVARWERAALEERADPDAVGAAAGEARAAIAGIIAALTASGALDDTVFAESRARALSRSGRSGRAIAAHLASRGIDAGASRSAISAAGAELLEDPAQLELAAALVQARRRRIGPFRADSGHDGNLDPRAARQRALAALARSGFSHDTATRALDTDRTTAERLIAVLRG